MYGTSKGLSRRATIPYSQFRVRAKSDKERVFVERLGSTSAGPRSRSHVEKGACARRVRLGDRPDLKPASVIESCEAQC